MSTNTPKAITPEQCRAARGWLGWTQEDLSKRAGVGQSTIKDFEKGTRTPIQNNRSAIERALREAGIVCEFDGAGAAMGLTWNGTAHGAQTVATEKPQEPEQGKRRGGAAHERRGK